MKANHMSLATYFETWRVEKSEYDLIANAKQIEQTYLYYHKPKLKGRFCVDEHAKFALMRKFIFILLTLTVVLSVSLTILIGKDVIRLDQLQRNASLLLLPLLTILVILTYVFLRKSSKNQYLSLFLQMYEARLIPTATLTESLIESSDELLEFCIDPYQHVLKLIEAQLGELQSTVEQWRGTQLENEMISLTHEVKSALEDYRIKFRTYEKLYQESMDTETIRTIDYNAKQSYDELKACVENYWFKRAQLISNYN